MSWIGPAVAGATTAFSIAQMVTQDKPEAPKIPKPPEPEDAKKKADAIKRQRLAARTRTIFTNPLGLQDQAGTIRRTVLGVS